MNNTRRASTAALLAVFLIIGFRLGQKFGSNPSAEIGQPASTDSHNTQQSVSLQHSFITPGSQDTKSKYSAPGEVISNRMNVLMQRELVADERASNQLKEDLYQDMFLKAGLSADQHDLLAPKLLQAIRLSMIAEQSLLDLEFARDAYRKAITQSLSQEQKAAIKDFSYLRPAMHEIASLEKFAAGKGVQFDPLHENAIVQAIADAGSITSQPFHGPEDPLAVPRVGGEAVTAFLQERLNQISNSYGNAIQNLRFQVTPEELQTIEEYYADVIASINQQLEHTKLPEEERIQKMLKESEAQSASRGSQP